MKNYEGEHSGVGGYEFKKDGIVLKFKDGKTYFYSNVKPGKIHVDSMKKLAQTGSGLATYVNKYVRDDYDERLN